jgi:hypothetical protein
VIKIAGRFLAGSARCSDLEVHGLSSKPRTWEKPLHRRRVPFTLNPGTVSGFMPATERKPRARAENDNQTFAFSLRARSSVWQVSGRPGKAFEHSSINKSQDPRRR